MDGRGPVGFDRGSALLLGAAIAEFQEDDFAGLITVTGFLVAFILSRAGALKEPLMHPYPEYLRTIAITFTSYPANVWLLKKRWRERMPEVPEAARPLDIPRAA